MNQQKNNTLGLLKLFASYMVVFIHVLFYGKLGVVVDALARFAVPFFFLVSGYYSYQIPCDKIKQRIQKILILLIFSATCCTAFEIICLLKYNMDGLMVLMDKCADLRTYVNLLVFNEPVISGHLWYILAALYVYIIFYFVTKFRVKEKVVFIISLSLLLLHILLGEGLSAFGIVLPIPYVRNFALMGIPFFALGLFVRKYEDTFRNIPKYLIFVFVAIGVAESILSRFLFGPNELYIGALFVILAIACVFIQYAEAKYPPFLTALDGCSTYIYVFHIMISTAICIIYGILGIDIYASVILENLHPIIVCVASTVFAYIVTKAKMVRKKNM